MSSASAARAAGYSETIARKPSKITSSKAVRDALDEAIFQAGASVELLAERLRDGLDAVRGKPCRSDDGLTGPGGVFASLNDMIAWDTALRRGTLIDAERLLKTVEPDYGFGWGLAEDIG
jgi:hypothetical protein